MKVAEMQTGSIRSDAAHAAAALAALDRSVLGQMSRHMEELVEWTAGAGGDFAAACRSFQEQHAASTSAFASPVKGTAPGPPPTAEVRQSHLLATLDRMNGFALAAARLALSRALRQRLPPRPPPADPCPADASAVAAAAASASAVAPEPLSPVGSDAAGRSGRGLFPPVSVSSSGSLDDLGASAADDWAATIANIADHAANILCLSTVACAPLRAEVQSSLVQRGALGYLSDALCRVDRETELVSFGEGFRTVHMNFLGNLSFEHAAACKMLAANEPLLRAVLRATSIDHENPGCAEWAEFTLANVCAVSDEGRDAVRTLRRAGMTVALAAPATDGGFRCDTRSPRTAESEWGPAQASSQSHDAI